MKSIFILLDSIITIYLWIIIINAILSWLVAFNILNTQNRFVFSVLKSAATFLPSIIILKQTRCKNFKNNIS